MSQKNDLKENVDFTFIIPEDVGKEVNIELINGKYSGVVFNFGKVSIDEDKGSDRAFLNFEFDIINSNNMENLHKDVEFKNHIGNVLTSIVINKVGDFGENEYEDGTDYIETSNL
jgi:hypothetical protein